MKVKVLQSTVIKGSVWPAGSILDESTMTPDEMQRLIEQKRVVEIKGGSPAPALPDLEEKSERKR